jgi:two-component sensor histidine kinase
VAQLGGKRSASDDTFYNLIKNAPFGVYLIDDQFRIAEVSAGAEKVFENVRPLIGHDFDAALRTIWPPAFAEEALSHFRHTLATGEGYHSADTVEERADIGEVESYDWQLERVTLPNGKFGVVCYFYDMTARRRAEAKLVESERELRRTKARLESALKAGLGGTFYWDIGNDRLITDENMMRYFSLPEAALSQGVPLEQAYPAIDPRDRDTVERALTDAVERTGVYAVEYRINHADGAPRWLSARGEVERDAAGQATALVGFAVDITERHAIEAHRELLLDELNHRVKNTLAVVQSIANQTFKQGGDVQSLREAFDGRLTALASAHAILTRTQWEYLPLRGIALEAIRACGIAEWRARIEGPDITLTPKPAIAFALAFHELCTNAVKYGAISKDEGRIDLSWRIATGAPDGALEVQWRESGGPRVTEPQRRGFGSAMIERVLAQETNGEVDMSFAPEGLVCTIRAPLDGQVLPADAAA